jgi:phage repressor protein C with HTH and peptisase S24 domain
MKSPKFLPRPRKPRLFLLRRVAGDSMLPALAPGTIVLGVRFRRLRPGDIVIIRHDGMDKIKRIKLVELDRVFLIGDNLQASTDSRDFGWLDKKSILARAIWPPRRRTNERLRVH